MSPLQQIQEVVCTYGTHPYQEYGREQVAPFATPLTLQELLELTPTEWEYKVVPLVEQYMLPSYELYRFLSEQIGKCIAPRSGWMWAEEVLQHGFKPCLDKRIWKNHGLSSSVMLYQCDHGTKHLYLQVMADGTGILYSSKNQYSVRSWSELEIRKASLPCMGKKEKVLPAAA
jgi:hypothetical protein